MTASAVADRYFDAWNRQDAEAIAAVFAADGTYSDPIVRELGPEATGAYAGALFSAFPDLAFSVGRRTVGDDGVVTAEWRMTGTQSGPYQGLPPSGRPVSVDGVDVIAVDGDRVRSVVGYFDGGAVPRQLGLQVIVRPERAGPFQFGTATRVDGADREPGAVSLTVLEVDPAEASDVQSLSTRIVAGLLDAPGFISWLGVGVGSRMYTITAWDDAADIDALRTGAGHLEASDRFFTPGGLGRGGQTGVWQPLRLNGMWARCGACDQMAQPSEEGLCMCGAALEVPRYW